MNKRGKRCKRVQHERIIKFGLKCKMMLKITEHVFDDGDDDDASASTSASTCA